MYHIVGFTPEAPTLEEAFGGKEPERKVVITNEDFDEVLNEISEEGARKIDFVMFGCPHFTLSEVYTYKFQIRWKRSKGTYVYFDIYKRKRNCKRDGNSR